MQPAAAYLASDRRRALAAGHMMPEATHGATLFADISGFTPLTTALVRTYGPRRGADELTRQLNVVYTALISEVERYGGSVIGFSGDAITCWFAASAPASHQALVAATRQATTAALAMQTAMQTYQQIHLPTGDTITLAIKTAVAAGPAKRFAVGNPTIQLIDVLAGSTLDRMAATEQMAQQGELLLDEATAHLLQPGTTISEWRMHAITAERFAVVSALQPLAVPVDLPLRTEIPPAEATAWVLPPVYARLQNEGERFLAELRPAAALFLKFTGLDYDGDSAAATKLAQYIQWVQGIVNHYEGALIQLTTGDKGTYLYAAFGAPIAHDDDIRRAVTVALELRSPPPHCSFITSIQIGVSQGAMRVGAYGSRSRQTYGVLGDETVVAARLMTQAMPGQIVVSQIIADAIGDEFRLQPLGEVKLKGKATAQPLYAVLQPLVQQRQLYDLYPTPLVGRTTELTQLMDELTAVYQGGQGRLVRVEGSAGVGKSHLVAALARQAQQQDFAIVSGACQSTNQDTAYFAVRLALRSLLALDTLETNPVDAQIAQVTTTITALNAAWSLRLPLLRDALALPIPDNATTAAFDAKLRYEALISLIVDLVQHAAQRQPLLLIFEDIHWMDEASQGVVLALARLVQRAPLLLLLVQRPPVRDQDAFLGEVAALTPQRHLALEELSPAGIAALVQQRLNPSQETSSTRLPVSALALSLIQAQTQGNPFFAEELVDALRDSAHLQLTASQWDLSAALTHRLRTSGCLARVDGVEVVAASAPLSTVDLGLPSTIQGVILARLDRLPEPIKLTVKVASVIGRLFSHELLLRAHPVQLGQEMLTQQLETLLQRDFARVEQPAPRHAYLFKHNITQEVIYQTLLTDQRQELHLAVARTLESLQPDNVEDLALHFYNSDMQQTPVRDKALHYLDAAGLRAKHDYANETALSYFNRALEVEIRPTWLQAKVEVFHILGRREEQATTLQRLAQQTTGSPFMLALLWGEYYEATSDYTQSEAAFSQALTLAQMADDQAGQARSLAQLGLIAWRQGNYEGAERLYREALVMAADKPDYREVEAESRYGLGLVYRQQGKFDEAQVQFRQNLTLSRKVGNRQNEAKALDSLGHVELLGRNYQAAIQYYQQALDIRKAIGDFAGIGIGLLNLAQGIGYTGDHGQAEPMLLEALKIHQAINNRWWETLVWNELGILYFMVGRFEKAKECLYSGLQLSQHTADEARQAYLLCNLGQVFREQGNRKEAEKALVDGLALAQKQGDTNLEAIYFSDLALVSFYAECFEEAIQRALISLNSFAELNLPLSNTTNLTILAAAHLALGHQTQALSYTNKALEILDHCHGEGPDFPQRDYWMCYQVLQTLEKPALATLALSSAHRLLMRQAERIHDRDMRRSYLENVPFNWHILQAIHTANVEYS
ncbi:MAG: tetratricopeptide repeat protein [Caldilineaceae bacterium]|nr:tetratricopeptide repeat protein [Caldilineaceae bacterium]